MGMMIEIDGSHGEGGGQLVRTSLSMAALTGQPIHVTNIRAGRPKPGLAPQHLTVVRALGQLCQATLHGDELGSMDLTFEPKTLPRAGNYKFDVAQVAKGGSAGSVTLLAQALLPVLAVAGGPSRLALTGGTHVRWSPSFDYLQSVYLPIWKALGLEVKTRLDEWGFYPAGGGRMTLHIISAEGPTFKPVTLLERGDLLAVEGVAVASNLPSHIPQRMTDRARNLLSSLEVPFKVQPKRVSGAGPGAGLFLTAVYQNISAGFSGHGELGKPSEVVSEEACQALLTHHASGAAVDLHLADQMLVPLALAAGTSAFRVEKLSKHFKSQAWLLPELVPDLSIDWDMESATKVVVTITGVGSQFT